MSNARNLANLLGTATTVQTAKIDDDAIISPELEIAKAIIRKLNTPASYD